MGDEKFKAIADEWLGSACGQVWDDAEAGASLAALLSRVDAEAVERMAKLCQTLANDQSQRAWMEQGVNDAAVLDAESQRHAMRECVRAIRSTLPTPAAAAKGRKQ